MFNILMGNKISPIYGSLKVFVLIFYLDIFIVLQFCDSLRGFWAGFPLPHLFPVWMYTIHFLLSSHGFNITLLSIQGALFIYSLFKRLYLLVIRSPYATCDLTFQVDLRWPVSLSADRTDQDKPISIWNKCLSPIMAPCEITHLWDTHRQKVSICHLKGKALLSKATVIT